MHLQMQRDVWLDKVLQYTVANLTSLRNVAFHWLTSEYMQLASGIMQLAAAGRRLNKVHFHCLFEGKMLIKKYISSSSELLSNNSLFGGQL